MKNFKWGTTSFYPNQDIYVVLFVSRNKDNKDIKDFKERRISFLAMGDGYDSLKIEDKFNDFVAKGQPGELSRCYCSVNTRDPAKIYKDFLHFLIDTPEFNLCYCEPKLAGIAAKKENAKSKKWMFDFDSNKREEVERFRRDLGEYINSAEVTIYQTPNGFAVVTEHGFDTREISEKWPDVNLKRDDLLCIDWKIKE